jgi:limonene-1,2-epoxide hydrolase
MLTNEEIVLRFCAAFAARMDADELIDYFTDDALYHNIPLPPLHGRAAIYASLKGLPARFTGLEIEIRNQIGSGNLVMNERIDYFQLHDRRVALPIAGVFELEQGKIKAWREYFDLATFQNGGRG